MHRLVLVVACVTALLSNLASASMDIPDDDLRKSVNELSASTLVGGAGWEVYERLLHPQYSRWAMGEIYERREKFVRSLEQWWNHGMRVAHRDIETIAVDMHDNLAIIRVRTTERFVGPDGAVEGFAGYVSNTWIREDGKWLLLSAEISSTQRAD